MSENIRSTNLRFNLEKDTQKRAWQYLQNMDKQQFKSYSNVIAVALVDYFDRYYRSQDDPYFETREREERFVNQIISSVESAIAFKIKDIPHRYFAVQPLVAVPEITVGAADFFICRLQTTRYLFFFYGFYQKTEWSYGK